MNTAIILDGSYRRQLNRFLEQFAESWLSDNSDEGKGLSYWAAYCIANGLSRPTVPSSELSIRVEEYYQLIEEAAKLLRRHIVPHLPSENSEVLQQVLEEGILHLQQEMRKRIAIYTADILCPAFRRPLESEAKQQLLRRFIEVAQYGKFDSPRSMMTTEEEAFLHRYKSYIENSIRMTLFRMFVDTLDEPLNKTEYWGGMQFKAESIFDLLEHEEHWPAFIRFVPW